MIALLNLARLLMVAWIVYALVLMFAPALLHQNPGKFDGAIQASVAFALGWLLDRAISAVHQRRARVAAGE
jgi:hypothetical protein